MLEMDVKINTGDIFDFLLAHTYNSSIGILGSCLGGILVVAGLITHKWICLFVGLLILLYLPYMLYTKSRKQANSPAFKQPLHYILDENGLTVSREEESQSLPWEEIYKATSTSRNIIIYTSKEKATIIPRRELGENKNQCIEIISTHMPPAKVKIRY